MIKFLQEEGPVKKFVLGGILVFVCLAMSAYLIPGGFGDYLTGSVTEAGVLARVGDQAIGMQEVQTRARSMARQQLRGGSVPPAVMPIFLQRAAENMITGDAMVYEADRLGLGVSDQELRDRLHQGPYGEAFFPGGNFIGQEQYEQLIENRVGVSVAQFERDVKDQIASEKLLATVSASATVSDKQIQEQVEKQDTKVKFDYAILTLDDVKKQVHPTDAELKAFYDQNKQEYANSIPEKRKARYIVIDRSKLADSIQVSQADLLQYYNQHQDEFRIRETVKISEIMIRKPLPGADGKTDSAAVEAAKNKAQDVQKQLKAGANFAELAKKHSEDQSSAQNGGLIEQRISPDATMEPELKKAIFGTSVGQVSGIIDAGSGFYIIRVEDKQAARMQTVDDVKGKIEPLIKQQKAAAASQKLADTVQSLARTNGLDKAAADKGLSITTTDMIANTDPLPGVGTAQDLMTEIFTVKKMDPPSTASVPQGYAIFQVVDVQPPQTPTFEQIKARVEDQFKTQRAQQMLAQKTQELSDRAHSEHDLKKAAQELGATVKTSDLVSPTGQVPDIGSLTGSAAQIFSLKPGEISGPIGLQSSGVVVLLVDKQVPSGDELKKSWDAAKETLLAQKRQELQELYIQSLRDRLEKTGKIKINKKEYELLRKSGEGT
jgi:peptidyl-prolyl cis-trans isomerase D